MQFATTRPRRSLLRGTRIPHRPIRWLFALPIATLALVLSSAHPQDFAARIALVVTVLASCGVAFVLLWQLSDATNHPRMRAWVVLVLIGAVATLLATIQRAPYASPAWTMLAVVVALVHLQATPGLGARDVIDAALFGGALIALIAPPDAVVLIYAPSIAAAALTWTLWLRLRRTPTATHPGTRWWVLLSVPVVALGGVATAGAASPWATIALAPLVACVAAVVARIWPLLRDLPPGRGVPMPAVPPRTLLPIGLALVVLSADRLRPSAPWLVGAVLALLISALVSRALSYGHLQRAQVREIAALRATVVGAQRGRDAALLALSGVTHDIARVTQRLWSIHHDLPEEEGDMTSIRDRVAAAAGDIDSMFGLLRGYIAERSRPIQCTTFDLAQVLIEMHTEMQPRAEQRGVRLLIDLHATPLLAWGQASATRRVVENLVANALRAATGSARATVTITTSAEVNCVLIEVMDTGPGIAVENQAHLFTPQPSLNGGLGLGLAIVQQLVVAQQATCGVISSAAAVRTTFWVRLQAGRDYRALYSTPTGEAP